MFLTGVPWELQDILKAQFRNTARQVMLAGTSKQDKRVCGEGGRQLNMWVPKQILTRLDIFPEAFAC